MTLTDDDLKKLKEDVNPKSVIACLIARLEAAEERFRDCSCECNLDRQPCGCGYDYRRNAWRETAGK